MSGDLCVFELTQPMGMFATLGAALLLAKACEEKGVEPYIMASSPLYRSPTRGPDWLSYFFDHRRVRPSAAEIEALRRQNRIRIIRQRGDINLFARGSERSEINNEFSRFSEARRLFDKFFCIKLEILEKADDFAALHFDPDVPLGIHYRGRAHRAEAEPVEYAEVTQAALDYFPKCSSVFVATEEPEFLDFARAELRGKKLVVYSNPTKNDHRVEQEDNYAKGLDALCDCLLLSRCHGLVKTPSALSTWSKLLGGEVPVALVGKPLANPYKLRRPWINLKGFGYFPEALLYNWDPRAMRENNVLGIIAEPPGALDPEGASIRAKAARILSKRPGRYAIITPYHKESRRTLERCLRSVRQQTRGADHILVADGFPQDWIDDEPVRHIRLDKSHADGGNTPRGIGALLAVSEGYDGIGLLDADNWLADDHIESCLETASRMKDCDVVVARRYLTRPDETILAIDDSPAFAHVDTSCFFFLRGSYHTLHYWITMPRRLWVFCDRVFWLALKRQHLRARIVDRPTVYYECLWASAYASRGEVPPPNVKADVDPAPVFSWLNSLNDRELQLVNRLTGGISWRDLYGSIARDFPCMCGSGKRYRECHGRPSVRSSDSTPSDRLQF